MNMLTRRERADLEMRRRKLIAEAAGRPMTDEQTNELHCIIGTLARDDVRRAEKRCAKEAA